MPKTKSLQKNKPTGSSPPPDPKPKTQPQPNTQQPNESEAKTKEPSKFLSKLFPITFNYSKKWLTVEAILLLIIITLSITYSIYRYNQSKKITSTPKPTPSIPSPTPSLDPTTNWKTYTNEKLGIQLKYPSQWSHPQESLLSTKTLISFTDGQEIKEQQNKLEITYGIYYDQNKQRNLTLEELTSQTSYPEIARATQKEITLNNLTGTHFIYHLRGLGYYVSNILLAKSDSSSNIIDISYRHSLKESNPDNPNPIELNQILSTFKFMDETNPTANWKTYINKQFGYKVQHPESSVPEDLSDDIYPSYIAFGNSQTENIIWFAITVRETNLNKEVEYIKWQSSHSLVKLTNETDIVVKGFPAKRLDYEPPKYQEPKPTSFVIVKKDRYSYTISARPQHITQILSTFEFIDPAPQDKFLD